MKSGTLEQLVQNLRARDIAAFPVAHANVADPIPVVRAAMDQRDFSHMPLRDARGNVVSILVRASAEPFERAKHVIEAAEPLAAAIMRLPEAGFLLVASDESGYEDRISGIINHADVVSLEVRLLIYSRTMQLERRVLDAIRGQPWGDDPELRTLWNRVKKRFYDGGERRSCLEAYLEFPEIMLIGQHRDILQVSDSDRARLRTARNFAAHAAIDSPAEDLRPEVITTEVEECLRLLETCRC